MENGVGILRAALNCTGGGEVKVDWVGRVPVDAPIAVLEGTFLSVTGENAEAEVYSGGSHARLFEVAEGGGLALTKLKLSGGSAEDGGGAIYSESATLTLSNCTFDGNTATNGSGGAVWASGGTVTIVGGEFLANNATGNGGAVHAVEGSLLVEGGARFEGNTATVGGAVFCGMEDNESGKPLVLCSITDAEFVSNSAAREDQEHVSDFSLIDGGGAAMFLYATVKITDSVFSSNYALLSGGALHGGFDTDILVDGCKFGNNTSDKFGGAISACSMTLGGGTQLTDNGAADDGGAVSASRLFLVLLSLDAVQRETYSSIYSCSYHIISRGQVRGRRTDSSHSGADE